MADHYFTAEPASADERRRLTVRLAGREVSVHTAPGVFSGSRLDPGTRVLLSTVPAPPQAGDLLDLGGVQVVDIDLHRVAHDPREQTPEHRAAHRKWRSR